LGSIRLSAAGSGGITLRGVARYFDGYNHHAAPGVTIQTAGQPVNTDRNGNYQLD